jgi:hypothetical protein
MRKIMIVGLLLMSLSAPASSNNGISGLDHDNWTKGWCDAPIATKWPMFFSIFC